MNNKKMTIPRDFIFNEDAIISYWENLQRFVGMKITQSAIAKQLKELYPNNVYYNAFDRKFATLKFYGFVHFESQRLMMNPYYKEYVQSLKNKSGVVESFLKVLRTSKHQYFADSNVNFFELIIDLIQDKNTMYVDLIDVITYLQHFDKVGSVERLKELIKTNRSLNFMDKVVLLEKFYDDQELGDISIAVHDAKTYLFSFLEANGFYTVRNSLQSKTYYQGNTPRKLEDRRLYLSKELLNLVYGYDARVEDIEYNSELEPVTGYYDESIFATVKVVEKSKDTVKAISRRYKTDNKLRNTALMRGSYTCEIALLKSEDHVTFISKFTSQRYAEVHHLVPMHAQEDDSFLKGDKLISLDQISNLIVLCPNCHRKIHLGRDEDVKPDLELLLEARERLLKEQGLYISKDRLFNYYKISPS